MFFVVFKGFSLKKIRKSFFSEDKSRTLTFLSIIVISKMTFSWILNDVLFITSILMIIISFLPDTSNIILAFGD